MAREEIQMENQKNNNICEKCSKKFNESDNFCAKCGEPLNDLAKEFTKRQFYNAQLKLVLKLIDEIKDEKTLLLLKSYVEKLSK